MVELFQGEPPHRHGAGDGLDEADCAMALAVQGAALDQAEADLLFLRRVVALTARANGGRLELAGLHDLGEHHMTTEHICPPGPDGACADAVELHEGPPEGCDECRRLVVVNALVTAGGPRSPRAIEALYPEMALHVAHRSLGLN
jgi:hypothetical protein